MKFKNRKKKKFREENSPKANIYSRWSPEEKAREKKKEPTEYKKLEVYNHKIICSDYSEVELKGDGNR